MHTLFQSRFENLHLKSCETVSTSSQQHFARHLVHVQAHNDLSGVHTERGEEPPVLSAHVALLQSLLDRLLSLLALGDLGESLVGDDALEAFELERVACWHQVVVVDNLDEGLDLAALGLSGLAHAAGDLLWVSLDSGDESVREGVLLAAIVLGLDNDNLLSGVTTARDDGLFRRC